MQSDADRRHDDDTRAHHDQRRGVRFSLVLIVASLLVVAIGWQSYLAKQHGDQAIDLAKKQADHATAQTACIKSWARDFAATTTLRVDARSGLDKAQKARNDALDDVLLVVIGSRKTPPIAGEKDFTAALRHYGTALEHLHVVEHRVIRVGNSNPYPSLDC